MQHLKTIEQQYQVLSELEHIRKRVGMYAGSPVIESREEYVFNISTSKMELKQISFIPALIKIISEAIDNVVDEHKRNPEKVNQIKLDINENEITIYDNGGIPVQIHTEFNKYVPEIIFGTLRSGSNYSDDEDQALVGTNGLGVKLLNVLSEYFIVETADGQKVFKQEFTNGMSERSDPIIKNSSKNFTKLTFKPDLKYFDLFELDQDHIDKIVRRLVDVAGSNESLKVYFNGTHIKIKNFDDYISTYTDQYAFDKNDNWEIGVASSSGFKQTSFVNSVETYLGGTHVNYVSDQIISLLREYFKKKHKVDVKPNDIKNHIHVFISCAINRPKFNSQVKDFMISTPNDYKTSWQCSDKFIKKILSLDIIQSVLDWVQAKEQAQLNAELRKLNKNLDKADPKKIPKFHDATSKNRAETSVYLVEGDCLEENTEIVISTKQGFISKQIKKVKVGDKVLTHLGNIKPVSSVQHRIKNVYRINSSAGEITASKEHKIFVYNTITDEFEFLQLEFIDKNIHKLVKSKLIDYDLAISIEEIFNLDDEKYKLEFRYTLNNEEHSIKTSLTHKFGCFDLKNQKFTMLEAQSVNLKDHLLLLKYNI
jgi:DNA topoisomerase-2